MTAELIALTARLERIEQDNATVKADNLRLRVQFGQAQRKLKVQIGLALVALVGAILLSPANRSAIAQGYGVTLANLNTRLSAAEAKTRYMTTDSTAKSTTFSGCNVIVNDCSGATNSIVTNSAGDGLGNLIIGYNELRSPNQDIRTGSHNLIIGDFQNYSSFGGLVAGYYNTVSGQYASISGGYTVLDSIRNGWAAGNTNTGLFSSSDGTYHSN